MTIPGSAAAAAEPFPTAGGAMKFFSTLLDNLEEYLCAALIGGMILSLSIQIGVRVITRDGMAWTEEFSRYCFIWASFAGVSLAAKKGLHVRISAQFALCSLRVRLFFRILADAAWICFNLFVVWQSTLMLIEGFEYPEISPALQWCKAWIELIVPVAFAAASLRIVQVYAAHLRTGDIRELVRDKEVGELL